MFICCLSAEFPQSCFPFFDEDLNSSELHPSAAHKCWSIRRGLEVLPSPPQLPSYPGSPISLVCRGGSEFCKQCGAHSGWWWRLGADQRLFLCYQQKHWKSSIPGSPGVGALSGIVKDGAFILNFWEELFVI